MALYPVKRFRLTESVTDRVIAMLYKDGYRPGARLPSERELRVQLAVGRSSIREALQALIGMGIIEPQAGRGYFVRAIKESSSRSPTAFSLAESHSLVELLEARLILEPEIAVLAAKNATTMDFAALELALLRITEAAQRGKTVYRAAAMFHVEFAKTAHNSALVQMVRSLVSVMSYWGRIFEWAPDQGQQELRLHRELFEYLKRRNPIAMRRKMREHILVTRQALRKYLQRSRGGFSSEGAAHRHSRVKRTRL